MHMNIDAIRKIDYWIGIPICFFLSIINNFSKLFRNKKNMDNQKKFLFIQLSEMGSTVIAYSAMEYIKKKYQKAQLYFLIFKRNKEGIDILNIINPKNVITIRDTSFIELTIDTLFAIWRLRCERIDVSFDLELFSRYSAILNYLIGAKTRVGFYKFAAEGLYRGNLQTHNVTYNNYYHMSQNFMALVKALEGPDEIPLLKQTIDKIKVPKIISKKSDKELMWKRLRLLKPSINKKNRIILLNPGTSKLLPLRKWPISYYAKLAKNLLMDKDTNIIVTGLIEDKIYADYIRNFTGDRCIDFTGKTKTLKELIDLYNVADILITNDSGPAHFSALTPIKTIVFYGPETPVLYSPLGNNYTTLYSKFACSPCVSAYNHRKSPCTNNRCLQAIKPEAVIKLVQNNFKQNL